MATLSIALADTLVTQYSRRLQVALTKKGI